MLIAIVQLSEIEINEEVGHGSFGCVSMGYIVIMIILWI